MYIQFVRLLQAACVYLVRLNRHVCILGMTSRLVCILGMTSRLVCILGMTSRLVCILGMTSRLVCILGMTSRQCVYTWYDFQAVCVYLV